jgi:molybdopterin-guanine dinucleotide biosynthesis protein A
VVAFACGVDSPLLVPAFVECVCGALRDTDDAVVPVIGGRVQPLLAAYRVAIVPQLRVLLAAGRRGLRDISGVCAVREISEQELLTNPALAAADPDLRSAANANTPQEWAALETGACLRG